MFQEVKTPPRGKQHRKVRLVKPVCREARQGHRVLTCSGIVSYVRLRVLYREEILSSYRIYSL